MDKLRKIIANELPLGIATEDIVEGELIEVSMQCVNGVWQWYSDKIDFSPLNNANMERSINASGS